MARHLVAAGMRRALAVGCVDPSVVAIEARRCALPASAVVVSPALSNYDRALPTLAHYDALTGSRS